jgi:hypothetical protein
MVQVAKGCLCRGEDLPESACARAVAVRRVVNDQERDDLVEGVVGCGVRGVVAEDLIEMMQMEDHWQE